MDVIKTAEKSIDRPQRHGLKISCIWYSIIRIIPTIVCLRVCVISNIFRRRDVSIHLLSIYYLPRAFYRASSQRQCRRYSAPSWPRAFKREHRSRCHRFRITFTKTSKDETIPRRNNLIKERCTSTAEQSSFSLSRFLFAHAAQRRSLLIRGLY